MTVKKTKRKNTDTYLDPSEHLQTDHRVIAAKESVRSVRACVRNEEEKRDMLLFFTLNKC